MRYPQRAEAESSVGIARYLPGEDGQTPVPCSLGLSFLSVPQNALTVSSCLEVQSEKSRVVGLPTGKGVRGPGVSGEERIGRTKPPHATFIQLK